MSNLFRALRVQKSEKGMSWSIDTCATDLLPEGEVTIEVHYSSLNYKDALSFAGNSGITKNYPHTPGIDACGVVLNSSSSLFHPGDKVICTGYDLGMNTWGGLSEIIRVPASWVVPLPSGLSMREAMIFGTSGFTAAQALHHFEKQEVPLGKFLVTGASGAVGSMAVALLAHAGHHVCAISRSNNAQEKLLSFGAKELITADTFLALGDKPLLKAQWNGVVDTVGGRFLSTALRSTHYRGTVTCCGMIDSAQLDVSIFPFILRGIKLIGLDSAECPIEMKKDIWQKLATKWKPACLQHMAQELTLDQVPEALAQMLAGKGHGKAIVRLK